MFDSSSRSIRRVLAYVSGWRAVFLLTPLPIVFGAFLFVGERWGDAFVLTLAIGFAVFVAVLILSVDASRSAKTFDRILGPNRRVFADLGSIHRRLEVIDSVISSETRRPWEPTAFPLAFIGTSSPKPVLLLPGADYHMAEISPIAEELHRKGVQTVVSVGIPHWDRTGDGLIWHEGQVFELPRPEQVESRFSALLTMKDWAGYAPLVDAAASADIPTFAKVEGAQDFHDADTSAPRNPYQRAGQILCQGKNDFDAIGRDAKSIVGSTRLERLWWAPAAFVRRELAVINLNFTYGVMTQARNLWLQTAIDGCESAGVPYVISVHPAERSRNPHPKATSISASRLLRHATVLISRFSTLPYESLARGVPFVYHNPHAEKVPAFKNALGAFPTTVDARGLSQALGDLPSHGDETRQAAEGFFRQHVDIDPFLRSESRSAEVIVESLR